MGASTPFLDTDGTVYRVDDQSPYVGVNSQEYVFSATNGTSSINFSGGDDPNFTYNGVEDDVIENFSGGGITNKCIFL